MSADYDCRCRTWKPRYVSPDAVAAYCSTSLGWLKRPERASLKIVADRAAVLETEQVTHESPGPPDARPLNAKVSHGGRPRLTSGCSKGHASWAWTLDRRGRGRCKLCERERRKASDSGKPPPNRLRRKDYERPGMRSGVRGHGYPNSRKPTAEGVTMSDAWLPPEAATRAC